MKETRETKVCSRCKNEKDKTEFGSNISAKDGLSSWCRICQNENNREIYRGKKATEMTRRKRAKEPVKNAARIILNNSLANKKIVKKPCFFCGAVKVDGHHLLYDFPLKVIWLCRNHHNKVHAEKKYG